MSALSATGEEHVESELGDILEVALGGRVVDGDERLIEEAEERVAVILVVVSAAASGSDGRSVGLTASNQLAKSLTIGRMCCRRWASSTPSRRPSFCAFSSSPYIAPMKAPPSAASTG